MTRTRQLLGAVSTFALIAVTATPAMAEGTSAGASITNTVNVDFQVGGVAQTAVSDDVTFLVDRKINVTVAAVGASPTASAGATGVVRQFTVTNNSNASVGYDLSAFGAAGGDYTPGNVTVFIDADNDGEYDAGEEITFLDSVAEDETVDVWVAFDVPNTVANGDTTDIILVANAHEAGTGAIGAEIIATSGSDDPNAIDTVLADAIGIAGVDGEYEGDHAASHSVTADAAALTVAKTSTVVSDPVNGTVDPKAIPGAVVEYCIVVSNASGAATATNVIVDDDLPTEVEFLPDYYGTTGDVMVNGDGACANGTEVDGYTIADTNVNESLLDVAGGQSRSLYFTVTIN